LIIITIKKKIHEYLGRYGNGEIEATAVNK